MSEQGDWHFVEEEIGPALENKTSSSTSSDENLQFMEASLTEPFFQSKSEKEETQLPLPAVSEMNYIEEMTSAGAVRDKGIVFTKDASDVLISSHRRETKDEDWKRRQCQPAPTAALTAIALVVLLLAGSVVVSSIIYASYTYPTEGSDLAINSPSSVLFRRPLTSPPSCSLSLSSSSLAPDGATDFHSTTARLPESSSDGPNLETINSRLDVLEIEVLSASHRVSHHDLRLTSLESQVAELTEMMLKFSSCGAHFYKDNPDFDSSKAVQGGKFSEGLFVEGKTKVSTPQGSDSKDLIHASHKCVNDMNDDTCLRDFQAESVVEKINAGGGGGGGGGDGERATNVSDKSDDAKDADVTPTATNKLEIDELRVRIAALEHGMDAIQSLLSASSDGIDQELATLSATLWKLQEKVEELEGIL